ncbi:MAG: PQQ-dependent sugar dehydrogenase [Rhodospirillales bacterium]
MRLAVAIFFVTCCANLSALADGPFRSRDHSFNLVQVASGLEQPWGMAFLPDGSILVTEKPGRLRLIDANGDLRAEPLSGVPKVANVGQGGLLDVAIDPDFAVQPWVYLTFAKPDMEGWGTAVARGLWTGTGLKDTRVIWEMEKKTRSGHHFGSRLAFAPDGKLHVSLGERGEMHRAQDRGDTAGGTLRLNPDGSIPADNPFVGMAGARPELFTYGNRNVQGMAVNPWTGEVWAQEHGPRGGDEVNRLKPGANYGWPVITYGIDYSGLPISNETKREGMEQPLWYWDPSIAPSGMAFYTGDRFPAWKGSLFIGALKLRHLNRLSITEGKVREEERLLRTFGERIRDVRQGPDGLIYILTDARNGRLMRLEPLD